jgi:hypothetical protein
MDGLGRAPQLPRRSSSTAQHRVPRRSSWPVPPGTVRPSGGSWPRGRSGSRGRYSRRACPRSRPAAAPAGCRAARAAPATRSTSAGWRGPGRLRPAPARGAPGRPGRGVRGRRSRRWRGRSGVRRGPGCGAGRGRRPGGRRWRPEGSPPLVLVLAVGQGLPGALVQDHQLVRRLVHPDGHHGQALGVFLLARGCHAVVVLLCALGMQFSPARDALCHKSRLLRSEMPIEKTLRARGLFPPGGPSRRLASLVQPGQPPPGSPRR